MTAVEVGVARRTLLVDDEEPLRALLRVMLEHSGRYEVVGEAGDGHAAIAAAGELQPELVLLDLSMPQMDGLETLPQLRAIAPAAQVVVLSGFDSERAGPAAIAAGAHAYLQKGLGPTELLAALDAARGDAPPGPVAPAPVRPDLSPPRPEELIAGLAHDVRTPLATALGAVDLVRHELAGQVSDEVAALLERSIAGLRRTDTILQAAVEHARADRQPLDPEEVAIGPLVASIIELLPGAGDRVRITGASHARAFADRAAAERILTNLIDNALHYTDGPVEVGIATGQQQVRVTIADRGPGLGADPERLFRPFVRGPAGRQRSGSGLGLATAVHLTRRLRGELYAEERSGGGTCLTLALPI